MKREIKEDELALIYTPEEGLRLELPTDEMPIGLDGAVLAGVFIRLEHDVEWAEELKRWVMTEVPSLSFN